jgi:trypsin
MRIKESEKGEHIVSESLYFIMLVFLVLLVIAGSASAKIKGNSKVVGGAPVRENAAPYMAALLYNEDNTFGCGGAIIHRYFVLTSAHCLQNFEPSDIRVLVGTNDLRKRKEIYQADQLIIHDR